jgi:DNA-binding MarR family transcriptional regulator
LSNDSPDHLALVDEVGEAIALFQNASSAVDAAAEAVLGLNATDLRAMGRLFMEGPTTAGVLAAHSRVSRGAMTTALDRLERAGYVRRVRSSDDRRQVSVELTDRALQVSAGIWGPIAKAGKLQLAAFSDEQLEFLLDFLRRGRELQEREAARIRAMSSRPRSASAPARRTKGR